MNSKAVSIVIVAVLSSCQMQCTCSSNALSFSIIIADQVENDSLIEEVKTTLDIINNDNDILPEYVLDYIAGEQVNY